MNETQEQVVERVTERERCILWLKDNADGRVLFTMVDYGKGQTDYVRVFIAPDADSIAEITYYAGRASERRVSDRGIAVRGGGFNKGLDIADDIARTTTGEPLDQLNGWQELH